MVFHPYDPQYLVMHPFGMAEPPPHLLTIQPDEIQLTLIPGLAFDRSGCRLGHGGGYFDRFLKDFNGVRVGVVFQVVLLHALPHDEQDVPVGWLVTESGLCVCLVADKGLVFATQPQSQFLQLSRADRFEQHHIGLFIQHVGLSIVRGSQDDAGLR